MVNDEEGKMWRKAAMAYFKGTIIAFALRSREE
jgi:hypothetical protein